MKIAHWRSGTKTLSKEAKQEFFDKIKIAMKEQVGTFSYNMIGLDKYIEKYGDELIKWLRKEKTLIHQLLK